MFFSNDFIQYFKPQNINSWVTNPSSNLHCKVFSDYLLDDEIKDMETNLLNLIKFILENNLLILPYEISNAKMYRAAHIISTDHDNGYFPISKSISTKCGTPSTHNEPTWFAFEPLLNYLNLSLNRPIGVVSCRKIRDSTVQFDKFNFILNLSTDTPACGDAFLINQELQTHINKVILVLIVRKYCNYSKTTHPTKLTYDEIIANKSQYTFIRTIQGYECDTRYAGGTVETLLKSWNYENGIRRSFYNEDRIQIQTLFDVFEIIEAVINKNNNIFNQVFLDFCNNTATQVVFKQNTKINLIGWVCKNAPTENCIIFPAEWAISMKYFKQPTRFDIFYRTLPDCFTRFFQYTQNPPHYIEIDKTAALDIQTAAAGKTQIAGKKHIKKYKYKYEYSDNPDDPTSDIFKVFFDDSENDKYTNQPDFVVEGIKKYVEYYEKSQSNYVSPSTMAAGRRKPKSRCSRKRKSRCSRKRKSHCSRKRCSRKHRYIGGTNENENYNENDNENTIVSCVMCNNQLTKKEGLNPRRCLSKYGRRQAHCICKDCWWDNEKGFAKEGGPITCPGCAKNRPLTGPPMPSEIDLTDD